MEYMDINNRLTTYTVLEERIGQQAYLSPTVFNFYLPDFQPARFTSGANVAPEFQIFTPPFAVGFLNGIFSAVDEGISRCGVGFGNSGGHPTCTGGTIGFTRGTTGLKEVVSELDLLLTG